VGVGNVTWFIIPSLALATLVVLERKSDRPNHSQQKFTERSVPLGEPVCDYHDTQRTEINIPYLWEIILTRQCPISNVNTFLWRRVVGTFVFASDIDFFSFGYLNPFHGECNSNFYYFYMMLSGGKYSGFRWDYHIVKRARRKRRKLTQNIYKFSF